jgi:hypothetical protein
MLHLSSSTPQISSNRVPAGHSESLGYLHSVESSVNMSFLGRPALARLRDLLQCNPCCLFSGGSE